MGLTFSNCHGARKGEVHDRYEWPPTQESAVSARQPLDGDALFMLGAIAFALLCKANVSKDELSHRTERFDRA